MLGTAANCICSCFAAMSFLNPLLLAGVAAVAIPILIHLLNKRKVEHVLWAAMRFLRVSIEQNERRLRIEDLPFTAAVGNGPSSLVIDPSPWLVKIA